MSNAAAGIGRPAAGDRIFLSSDHSESGGNTYAFPNANTFGVVEFISVNRAGNVPPQTSDQLSGAAIIGTASLTLDALSNYYWQGINFSQTAAGNIVFNYNGSKSQYFRNCTFFLNTANASSRISTSNPAAKVTWDNCTVQFGSVSQGIQSGAGMSINLDWRNTPSAIQGSNIPTSLFLSGTQAMLLATCRGIDFNALTTTLYTNTTNAFNKLLLDSCRIASGVTRYSSGSVITPEDEIELVNCYDGTHFLAERHTPAGDVTTEFSTTMVGGAQDDVGLYSHKLVSSTRCDPWTMTLDGFWLDVDNTNIGSARTATVEIISSASLNNIDISLVLQYEGTAGSSLASFVSSLPNALTASAALPTSTATWNSPPATPVAQHIPVTFTPQQAGRVRGLVRLGKPSTTVWVNPQVIVT